MCTCAWGVYGHAPSCMCTQDRETGRESGTVSQRECVPTCGGGRGAWKAQCGAVAPPGGATSSTPPRSVNRAVPGTADICATPSRRAMEAPSDACLTLPGKIGCPVFMLILGSFVWERHQGQFGCGGAVPRPPLSSVVSPLACTYPAVSACSV